MGSERGHSSWCWDRRLAQKNRGWKGKNGGRPQGSGRVKSPDIHMHKGTEMQLIEPVKEQRMLCHASQGKK